MSMKGKEVCVCLYDNIMYTPDCSVFITSIVIPGIFFLLYL